MTDTLRTYLMANDDIVMICVVLLFALFTLVLYRSRMIFLYKINTFFSSRQTYAANEISTSNEEFVDIMLLIMIGCLSVSSILYNGITPMGEGARYGLLMIMFIKVLLLIVLKGMIYSLVNWTFFTPDSGRGWLSAYFFSVAVVSILTFPLALLSIFHNKMQTSLTYCLFGIVILQKILLLCKLYVNFRPKGYGSLLFFLYFCSVEMMPSLVTWHLLSE